MSCPAAVPSCCAPGAAASVAPPKAPWCTSRGPYARTADRRPRRRPAGSRLRRTADRHQKPVTRRGRSVEASAPASAPHRSIPSAPRSSIEMLILAAEIAIGIALIFGRPALQDCLNITPVSAIVFHAGLDRLLDPFPRILLLGRPQLLGHHRRQWADVLLVEGKDIRPVDADLADRLAAEHLFCAGEGARTQLFHRLTTGGRIQEVPCLSAAPSLELDLQGGAACDRQLQPFPQIVFSRPRTIL